MPVWSGMSSVVQSLMFGSFAVAGYDAGTRATSGLSAHDADAVSEPTSRRWLAHRLPPSERTGRSGSCHRVRTWDGRRCGLEPRRTGADGLEPLPILVAVGAMALAACGSSTDRNDGGDVTVPTADATPTDATAADAAAAADSVVSLEHLGDLLGDTRRTGLGDIRGRSGPSWPSATTPRSWCRPARSPRRPT